MATKSMVLIESLVNSMSTKEERKHGSNSYNHNILQDEELEIKTLQHREKYKKKLISIVSVPILFFFLYRY